MTAIPRNAFGRALRSFYDWLEAGAGSVPALTGVAVTESGVGPFKKTVITFTNHALAMVDAAGVVAYAGRKVYDFPAGSIKIFGAVLDLDLTKSSAGVIAAWDGDISVGTVTASNNATLSTTEQDIVPTTATPQAVAGVTTGNARNAADITPFDGTTTAVDVYVNILVDDADHDVTTTPCNLILNGTLTIHWANLGDY